MFGSLSSGLEASDRLCVEGNWTDLPTGDLFRALRDNTDNPEKLRKLLSKPRFKEEVNCLDGDKFGLLHHLGLNSKISIENARAFVKVICEHGGDLDLFNPYQETGLHIAACYGNEGMIRALVENGANVHVTNIHGHTPLAELRRDEQGHPTDDVKRAIVFLEAAVKIKGESPDSKRADDLRQLGNLHYTEKSYEKAIEIYLRALDLWEDHRTYGNLSAAYIKLANNNRRQTGLGFRKNFLKGHQSAGKASTMEPSFLKHYYRKAKAYVGYRQLPFAKMACRDGMKAAEVKEGNDYQALKQLHDGLEDLGVPDYWANQFSDAYVECKRKLEARYMAEFQCPFCELFVVDLDENGEMPSQCNFCVCDPRKEVDEDLLDKLTLF
mmetsp:Transcript_20795/g.26865  ORF Transcript_20795/g.26865 Transcript_20795/m.26865 type:complete len:382 (-) Transcript_20795:252-1397(-)|eukprot:CAMPEP_0198145310 /NCGR_PEP_ID=MMETSP1443-20131203/22612_1 /TAXON_ID=186043 /ORGANISM="Entomoneis sp., Strain CCMP2396" /LENGTH=381 /DNA_ID=CAMNT_0043808909 /DNA_START=61 /DNA_END=1206 /DNA_ORIENTATION=+